MAVTRQKKEEVLKELVEKFSRSKSVVFANYRGLDVASISELRSELRKEDAEMKVAKKTLMGLAAKDIVGELDKSVMEGPVVATFSYEDPLSGIRILFKFSKKNDNIKLLGGIVDGKVVGPEVIQQYAKLPGRLELLAKLIGSMNAPLSGFVGIGNGLIGGIVRVLNAYKDTMPAEATPAPAPAPAPEAPAPVVEEKAEEAPVAEEEKKEEEEAPAETV
ncbi:50S ribosomal protein L10 [Patescibacteria group bacterium]|nr:50S ribosomal protein L10 [Patescibacteria group bacterium]MBU1015831.1 50S ribosomal protein L10 [Patescibacteria group bacterium]MBU1685277.1 50S ribosomal protein L10 [Patescibacteria group bacterium]MBU1938474.1 50S ribosomal protein L10 [Patescibacteria group bacterium]